MSDTWIVLIPENPRHVPEPGRQSRARERLAEIAPDSDAIEIKVSDHIKFFDCGGNFERVCCPSCDSELPPQWWQNRMGDDFDDGGFKLTQYPLPCCDVNHSLDQLIYNLPQGFARFALNAMNPDIGKLSDQYKAEFEKILGTRLRIIYQHI